MGNGVPPALSKPLTPAASPLPAPAAAPQTKAAPPTAGAGAGADVAHLPPAPPASPLPLPGSGPAVALHDIVPDVRASVVFGAGGTNQAIDLPRQVTKNAPAGPDGFFRFTGRTDAIYKVKVNGQTVEIDGFVSADGKFYAKNKQDSAIVLAAGGTLTIAGMSFTIEHDANFDKGGDPAPGKPTPNQSMKPLYDANVVSVSFTKGVEVGHRLTVTPSGSIARIFSNHDGLGPAFDRFAVTVGLTAKLKLPDGYAVAWTAGHKTNLYTSDGEVPGAIKNSPSDGRIDSRTSVGAEVSHPVAKGVEVFVSGTFLHQSSVPQGRTINQGEGFAGVRATLDVPKPK
jgi:hypothetical protein